MKNLLSLLILTLALSSIALAQSSKTAPTDNNNSMSKIRDRKPFEYDNETTFDANGVLRRGDFVRSANTVSLDKVLKNPKDYVGKTVVVKGVIVRSCKMEGCWMELAPAENAKSVRVTFKNHAFFIPLDSAGLQAKAEGVFSVKTLSREQVEHLVKEDGAKFENVNKDGTVTEISFEASGVELTKNKS